MTYAVFYVAPGGLPIKWLNWISPSDSLKMCSRSLTLHHAHNANKHARTQRERERKSRECHKCKWAEISERGRGRAKSSPWTQSERASALPNNWLEERDARTQPTNKGQETQSKTSAYTSQINGTIVQHALKNVPAATRSKCHLILFSLSLYALSNVCASRRKEKVHLHPVLIGKVCGGGTYW